jgi:hypothetical protein
MLYDCSPGESPTTNVSSTRKDQPNRRWIFSSPITIVFIVWGLMFLGLGLVLAYD